MAQSDELFAALDALYTKRHIATPPSMFIVNRFLAWDQGLAPFAAAISRLGDRREVVGDGRTCMAWEVWRTALPRGRGARRLGYPAPKKQPGVEGLVAALMERTHLSRADAEVAADIAAAAGQLEAMQLAYGVETEVASVED